ncbi:DUF2877 domain-containing protein [Pedococcus bigeumensis]|uniref:DUF2877 domain-containing protein n=1 Tax=Pedococcus bigeumensis TaxID=433644 RepID=UPI00138695DA|nr:DUF2877 domain-containing protein [Pedococcus bigeumensis]
MAASETLWPAAVSERSVGLLHGQPRRARVLGSFPTALYLQVGGHAEVLPVVTPDGLRLPTALAVATVLPTVGWGTQPGDEVVVGGGEVRLSGLTIRALRTWRPHQVAAAEAGAGVLSAPLAPLRLAWRASARTLTDGLLAGDLGSLTDRVGTLVGAGPGLTPSGDDVLCGILLGLRLHPRGSDALRERLWAAVRPRLMTTTSLSAALLTEAEQGYAVAPVVRLVEALAGHDGGHDAGHDPGPVEAVQAVLAIGHSSGADLLGGLAGCLDALDALDSPDLLHQIPRLATTRRSLP